MTFRRSSTLTLFFTLAFVCASSAQNTTQSLRDEIFRRGVASDPDVPGQDGHGLGEVLSGHVDLEASGLLPLPTVEIMRGAIDAVSGVRETSHHVEVQLFQGLYLVTHAVRLESRAARASEVIWKMPVVANTTALARVEVCALDGDTCDPERRSTHSVTDTEVALSAHYAQYVRSIARVESSTANSERELGPATWAELEDGEIRVRVAPVGHTPVQLSVSYVAMAELIDGRYTLSIPARRSDPRLSEIEFSFISDECVDLRLNDVAVEREYNAWHGTVSPERNLDIEVREPRTFRTMARSTTIALRAGRNTTHTWVLAARCSNNCAPPTSIGIAVDLSLSTELGFARVESLLRKLEQAWHDNNTTRIDLALFATRTVLLTFHAGDQWVDAILARQGTLGRTTNTNLLRQVLARSEGVPWLIFSDEVLPGAWPRNASFALVEGTAVSRSTANAFALDASVGGDQISERLFAPTLARRSGNGAGTDHVRAGTGVISTNTSWIGALREQTTVRDRSTPLALAIVANSQRLQTLVAVPSYSRRNPCASGSLALATELHTRSAFPRGPLALAQAVFSCRDSLPRVAHSPRTPAPPQTSMMDPTATGLAMDAARNLLRQQALAAIRSCLRDDRRGRTRFSRRFVLRFQLRRREVENFRIEGNLPETLSTCLENAVTEVAVPEFEQTLDIRWPLYTEAALEPESAIPLDGELDAQVRAIGIDIPRNPRLLSP